MGNRQEYIHNVARTIMGQLGMKANQAQDQAPSPQWLYDSYGKAVWQLIFEWSDETLGRIVACGIGYGNDSDWHGHRDGKPVSLDEVEGDKYFALNGMSGRMILHELALRAIIAAIVDILRSNERKAA